VIPFLLAATPLSVGTIVPFKAPPRSEQAADAAVLGQLAPIDTFDPVARAALISSQLPRQWNGTYQAFNGGSLLPVTLKLVSVRALGQMVSMPSQTSSTCWCSPPTRWPAWRWAVNFRGWNPWPSMVGLRPD
jgi:hypothetical protein